MATGAIESGTRDKGSDPSRDKDSAETDDSRFHRGSDPLSRVPLSIAPVLQKLVTGPLSFPFLCLAVYRAVTQPPP